MINAIIKGIFWVITKLFSLILYPIVALVSALFPDLTNTFIQINSYLAYSFTYVRSILHLLLVPDSLILFYFNFLVILNTIYFGVVVYRFAINVYNKLKI